VEKQGLSLFYDDGGLEREDSKRLGIFIVREKPVPRNLRSHLSRKGTRLGSDSVVLELNLPAQELRSLKSVRLSLVRLSDYLEAISDSPNPPVYLVGLTYLSGIAQRYGFELTIQPFGKEIFQLLRAS